MRGEYVMILMVFAGIPLILAMAYRSYLAQKRFMKVIQLKAEANAKLLDRFGQDPALLEYLKSDVQKGLFDVRIEEPSRVPPPYMRMLTAAQAAFLLMAGGAACLWFSARVDRPGDQEGFIFIGALGVALGIGALLSAGAAFVVARMWRTWHAADEARS